MQVSTSVNLSTAKAKWAFTTRRVNQADVAGICNNLNSAVAGDLVLAEVLTIGSHKRLQLTTGRPSALTEGDKVILCCGDRYAPDQFEGFAQLGDTNDMLASGGIIGQMQHAHSDMGKPTQLRAIGLLTDRHHDVINIARYKLPESPAPNDLTVIGVIGTSMNAGKTTTAASLAHGLCKAGHTVAGIKATGTGAYGDYNAMLDASLDYVADFTDAGMPSTYLQPIERIELGLGSVLADAKKHGVTIAIVELADGIYQKETAALIQQSSFIRQLFGGVVFASGDAVSVVGGVQYLRQYNYEPIAISGKVSLSPLAMREAEKEVAIKIYKREELMTADIAMSILQPILSKKADKKLEKIKVA